MPPFKKLSKVKLLPRLNFPPQQIKDGFSVRPVRAANLPARSKQEPNAILILKTQ